MAGVHSMREVHSGLAEVCDSLEALFRLASGEDDIVIATAPAMTAFRRWLDEADQLIPGD